MLGRWIWIIGLMVAGGMLAQAQASSTPALPISEDVIYTVRQNDVLELVGALFDVSPTCIAELNELEAPVRLSIGQELLISVACPRYGEDPRDEGSATVTIPREVVTFEDSCTGYRVQRNDSIELIGFTLDISAIAIAQANGLEVSSIINVGDCLVIPEGPEYGEYPALYPPLLGRLLQVDVPTDLEDIARTEDKSLRYLAEVNNINLNRRIIVPGMSILIPDEGPAFGEDDYTLEDIGQGGGALPDGEFYVVQVGDNLDLIAQSLDLRTSCLAEANSLTKPGFLRPGQVILIDRTCPAYAITLESSIRPADAP